MSSHWLIGLQVQSSNWSRAIKSDVLKFKKLENVLSSIKSENENVRQSTDMLSLEIREKESALKNLEQTKTFLENDLERIEIELAEKRLQASKFSTNDQLYQFRVFLYRGQAIRTS